VSLFPKLYLHSCMTIIAGFGCCHTWLPRVRLPVVSGGVSVGDIHQNISFSLLIFLPDNVWLGYGNVEKGIRLASELQEKDKLKRGHIWTWGCWNNYCWLLCLATRRSLNNWICKLYWYTYMSFILTALSIPRNQIGSMRTFKDSSIPLPLTVCKVIFSLALCSGS
jgi:hypothetical protein